ncbi:hypothetical protein BDV11DRAFT_184841 [Aspergillus similis]
MVLGQTLKRQRLRGEGSPLGCQPRRLFSASGSGCYQIATSMVLHKNVRCHDLARQSALVPDSLGLSLQRRRAGTQARSLRTLLRTVPRGGNACACCFQSCRSEKRRFRRFYCIYCFAASLLSRNDVYASRRETRCHERMLLDRRSIKCQISRR